MFPVTVRHYFGELPKWALLDMNLVGVFRLIPTPVGRRCFYCTEVIKEDDSGFILSKTKITHMYCYQLAFLGALQAVGRQAN